MSDYQQWLGKTQDQTDVITESGVDRFCAALDVKPDTKIVPAGFHWCLCLPKVETSGLGDDGHPPKGGFMPAIDLPRRMWAASQLEFHAPMKIGMTVLRRSTIASVKEKTGKSGGLVFVEIDHQTLCDDSLLVAERQTIVYREAASKPMSLPKDDQTTPTDWQMVEACHPSPQLLFRYSSLTFNSHRIHYDLAYAKSQELYPDLVVHAPLMATQALLLAERHGQLATFSFKAVSPAFCSQSLYLAAEINDAQAQVQLIGGDGRTCLESSVTYR